MVALTAAAATIVATGGTATPIILNSAMAGLAGGGTATGVAAGAGAATVVTESAAAGAVGGTIAASGAGSLAVAGTGYKKNHISKKMK